MDTESVTASQEDRQKMFQYDFATYGGRIESRTRSGTITCKNDPDALVVHLATTLARSDESTRRYIFSVWFGDYSPYNKAGRCSEPQFAGPGNDPRYEAVEALALLTALETIDKMDATLDQPISQIVILTERRTPDLFRTIIANFFDKDACDLSHPDTANDSDLWLKLFAKMVATKHSIVFDEVRYADPRLTKAISFAVNTLSCHTRNIQSVPTPDNTNLSTQGTIDNETTVTVTTSTFEFQQGNHVGSPLAPQTTLGMKAKNGDVTNNGAGILSISSESGSERIYVESLSAPMTTMGMNQDKKSNVAGTGFTLLSSDAEKSPYGLK